MSPNPLLKGLRPTHPGEILREITLPAIGKPKTEIAELLGISRMQLFRILDEKNPITPNTAVRFAKLTGSSPEFWMNLQNEYDLQLVELELAAVIKKIPTLKAAEDAKP